MKKILFFVLISFAAYGQGNFFDYTYNKVYTASGTNTYSITQSKITGYYVGLNIYVKFTNSNATSSTLRINSLAYIPLLKLGGSSLSSGDIASGEIKQLIYDGSNFVVLNVSGAVGGGSGDMILASTQTNTGLKTFLDGTLGLRNVANTFTSQFTNTNSAARTYTLPNWTGNVVVASGELNDFNGGGFSYDDGVLGSGKIEFNPFVGFSLTRYDGPGLTGDLTSLNFNSGSQIDVFSNVSGFAGLTYDADYSANYTNRSLVDKAYVDAAGGFTVASLAEAQAGTDNTKGMTPLRISQTSKDKSIGKIYAKDSWANLNDFDVSGTSPTIVSNEIRFNNSFTFDHYIRLKTSVANITSRQNWYFSTMIRVGTGSAGGWFGLKSSAINKMSLITSWNAGTLALQGGDPVWSVLGSTATLSASVSDLLFIDMRRIGNRIIVTGRNITTGGSQVVINYIFPSATVTPVTTPNTGRWVYGSFGVTDFLNTSITSTDQQGADIAGLGDSIMDMYSVSDFSKTYLNLLRRTYDVVTFAGPNDTSTDVLTRVQEVIDANPKNAILSCWINDTASGLSNATSTANIDAIYTALNAAGINVLFMNYYNTVASLTYMETHLSTNYPTRIIDPQPLMNTNALNADGVHMNDLGNEIYAAAIKASNKIIVGKNYGGLKSQLDRVNIEIGTPVLNGTTGSVAFFDVNGVQQDNSNLFWDNTNNRLGIGTNAPTFTQDIRSGDYYQQFLKTTNSSTVAGTIYENDRASNTSNGLIGQRGSSTTPDYFGGSISDMFTIASYGANSNGMAIGAITADPLILYTNDTQRLSITSAGAWGLSGANYGTAGQQLTSQGPTSPPIWSTAGSFANVTGTDANITGAVQTNYHLPVATLSTGRNFIVPTGADGDEIEIFNNEATYTFTLTGATVYLADRTTVVTSLLYNVPTFLKKINGLWIITN